MKRVRSFVLLDLTRLRTMAQSFRNQRCSPRHQTQVEVSLSELVAASRLFTTYASRSERSQIHT